MLFALSQRIEKSESRFEIVRVAGQHVPIEIAGALRLFGIEVGRTCGGLDVGRDRLRPCGQRLVERERLSHAETRGQREHPIERKLALHCGKDQGRIERARTRCFTLGQGAVKRGEPLRSAAGVGRDRSPSDQARGGAGPEGRALGGGKQSGIPAGEFGGQRRRPHALEREDPAAQPCAVGGLDRQDGLIVGQRDNVLAACRGDLGMSLQHIDAFREADAQVFRDGRCFIEPVCIGQGERKADLRVYAFRFPRSPCNRFPIERLGEVQAFEPPRRARQGPKNVRRSGCPVDPGKLFHRGGVVAGPSEHNRVIAEDVLAFWKSHGQRAQTFGR